MDSTSWRPRRNSSRPKVSSPRILSCRAAHVALHRAVDAVGFHGGITSGSVAGLLLGRNDKIARVFAPFIVAFNSLPRIALVPLITMVFGFGLLAKIVLAWSIVFFIVFFNTFQGARSVDADLISSARFLGAGERQILRTVIVPSTLAWTFASLTPSISFALIGVVVGEFIGGESGGGRGFLLLQPPGTRHPADK